MQLIPTLHDFFGWAAALLTLLAFSCNNIVRLRYVALSANAAFIAYGFTSQLWPVFFLHAVLVPINLWRLQQALRPSLKCMADTPVHGLAPVPMKTDNHA